MEKIENNYDITWGVDENNDGFALKSYNVNGSVRAFVVLCHDEIPIEWAFDVNAARFIKMPKDKDDLIDDQFMEIVLENEKDMVGFDICDYDTLLTLGINSVYDFLDECKLPTSAIIKKLNSLNPHRKEK